MPAVPAVPTVPTVPPAAEDVQVQEQVQEQQEQEQVQEETTMLPAGTSLRHNHLHGGRIIRRPVVTQMQT